MRRPRLPDQRFVWARDQVAQLACAVLAHSLQEVRSALLVRFAQRVSRLVVRHLGEQRECPISAQRSDSVGAELWANGCERRGGANTLDGVQHLGSS